MRNGIPIPTSNYLAHAKGHKYIKKIKTSYGTRYFYTPAELMAFYKSGRDSYLKDNPTSIDVTARSDKRLENISYTGREELEKESRSRANKKRLKIIEKQDPRLVAYHEPVRRFTSSYKKGRSWYGESKYTQPITYPGKYSKRRKQYAREAGVENVTKHLKKTKTYKSGRKAAKKITNLFK